MYGTLQNKPWHGQGATPSVELKGLVSAWRGSFRSNDLLTVHCPACYKAAHQISGNERLILKFCLIIFLSKNKINHYSVENNWPSNKMNTWSNIITESKSSKVTFTTEIQDRRSCIWNDRAKLWCDMSDMKVVPVLVTKVSCLTELPLTMNIRKYPAAKCKFSGELCNTYSMYKSQICHCMY